MNIKQYLDSTYLKTASQANLSEIENTKVVENFINEAISEEFKLVMVRPDKVQMAKKMIDEANSKVLIGTVIDFPEGNSSLEIKIEEAQEAINNQADELDFVINYEAQIIQVSVLIKNTIITNFKEDNFAHVFVKSSTGFYKTPNNLPNGATIETIILMLENSYPLPVKAAGGVRTLDEALD
ncbi:deoxyribose-phosphate aldolase [Flavobacterium psychrophilum]|uniref:deoxyribose-phosphate aldolase n=1 Tax=Flavobacterium psychrophilum TaxID=96345 RepID=UPI001F0B4CCC|nr:deoxyribose-phosphate aldolase [Flavobacterium psychrophilum]